MWKYVTTTAATIICLGLIGCRSGGTEQSSAETASNIPDRRTGTGNSARGETDTFGTDDEGARASADEESAETTASDDPTNPSGTTASTDPRGAREAERRTKKRAIDHAIAENQEATDDAGAAADRKRTKKKSPTISEL